MNYTEPQGRDVGRVFGVGAAGAVAPPYLMRNTTVPVPQKLQKHKFKWSLLLQLHNNPQAGHGYM